jgi:magnesium-transporting ATPase (P-type)
LPVSKCVEPLGEAAGLGDRRNMVFAGTVATYGRGRAVVAVVHLPFLQRAFQTTPLAASDWLTCVLVASSVVWVREGSKALMRRITAAR